MNRLEQIKKRIDTEFYVHTEGGDGRGTEVEYREGHNDIQYLLSKLEIAEKMYKEIEKDAHTAIEYGIRNKAREAIRQIRE